MNDYTKRAEKMRKQIDKLTKNFTDEQAVANKELYQNWNGNGIYLSAGDIVLYDDEIYRVNQPHTTQFDWTPDKVPALYSIISIGDEYPQWKPGSYAKGTKRSNKGKRWISNVDNNIWEPGATGVYTWTEVV